MTPTGVIFDNDGVLMDSAELHRRSWHVLAGEMKLSFSDDFFRETFGQTNPTILARFLRRPLDREEAARLSERKEELFRREAKGRIALFPGVEGMLAGLKARGFRLALGTSTPRSNVEFFLRELGLGRHLEAFACMEDVERGKPDPAVFLLAARHLGVPPARCVVVEDAFAGVEAARAAGMKCVAVAPTNTAAALREKSRPDLILDAAADLTPEAVEALL